MKTLQQWREANPGTFKQFGVNVGVDSTIGAIGGVVGSALGGPVGGAVGALGASAVSQLAQRIINAVMNRKEDPVKAVLAAMNIPDNMRKNDRVAQSLDLPDELSSAVSDQVKMKIAQEVAIYLQYMFRQPSFNINNLEQGVATKRLTAHLTQLLAKYRNQ